MAAWRREFRMLSTRRGPLRQRGIYIFSYPPLAQRASSRRQLRKLSTDSPSCRCQRGRTSALRAAGPGQSTAPAVLLTLRRRVSTHWLETSPAAHVADWVAGSAGTRRCHARTASGRAAVPNVCTVPCRATSSPVSNSLLVILPVRQIEYAVRCCHLSLSTVLHALHPVFLSWRC